MIKMRFLCVVLCVVVVATEAREVVAQDPPDLFLDKLSDYQWIGPNGGNWQSPANWMADANPAPIDPALSLGYPNDPGRTDADQVDIRPAIGANFSSALTGDRTVNITGGNVTVASIKLGGTGTAVTTSIASASNLLVFENQELNDHTTTPGGPNNVPIVEPIYAFNGNYSTSATAGTNSALIWSTGTAGVGKQNRIDADIKLNDNVDVEGNRDLHIYGDLVEGDENTTTPFRPSSITSLLTGGARLYIHGNIDTGMAFDSVPDVVGQGATEGTQERMFGLNSAYGVVHPVDPQNPVDSVPRTGIVDFLGEVRGTGWFEVGHGAGTGQPLKTVILRSDMRNTPGLCNGCANTPEDPDDDPFDAVDPFFGGRFVFSRGNLVLDNDGAFGSGTVTTGALNTVLGTNVISTSNSRNIPNNIDVSQWVAIRGASDIEGIESFGDNSITFSGRITTSNSRGFINLLPYNYVANTGPTLTLSGPQYGLENQDIDNLDVHRPYTMDGSGKTLITGGIHNRVPEQAASGLVNFRKRGTGTVVIDFNESNVNDTASDYQGNTIVQGGNLHFTSLNDLPAPTTASTGTFGTTEILSEGGAVGFDNVDGVVMKGLFTAGGALEANAVTFLNMLNNSANMNAPDSSLNSFSELVGLYGINEIIYSRWDRGGLMLAADEYDDNLTLNFSGSQVTNPLARAANMSLAAHEGGSSFNGTIIPAGYADGRPTPDSPVNPTGVSVEPNTFKLGGGSGVLTLPNNNQLVNGTVNRNLLVANGSEVRIQGTHTYSGTTTVMRAADGGSMQVDAAEDEAGEDESLNPQFNLATRLNTTLTVTTLANGGVASSIGNSTSAASNVVVQGGTLKYVGGAVSTNRLFTVGTAGGTIDASGSGALTFSSTSALGIDVAESRVGYVATDLPGGDNNFHNDVIGVPGIDGGAGFNPFDTSDLVVGMVIKNTANLLGNPLIADDDSELEIVSVGQNVVTMDEVDLEADDVDASAPNPWTGYPTGYLDVSTFVFGPAPARFLTLTGSNSANNTLNPLVTDAADIGTFDGAPGAKGSVGITKSGTGKWILTNNNTYTATTTVENGTLLINGTHNGGGAYNVTASVTPFLEQSGTLGGTGSITGALTVTGYDAAHRATMAPGASVGTFTVIGNTVLGDFSNLAIELSGATADKLAITGDLDLSSLSNALTVTGSGTGSSWLIATYSGNLLPSIGALFESITAGYGVDATSTPGSIFLTTAPIATKFGDYNGDDVVDAADYTVWRNNFGAATEASILNRGDGGNVGEGDYIVWKQNYGTIYSPGSGGLAAVPEPASLVLVGFVLAALGCCRSRR